MIYLYCIAAYLLIGMVFGGYHAASFTRFSWEDVLVGTVLWPVKVLAWPKDIGVWLYHVTHKR